MARGKESSIVGGKIDPFVQQSMQQNKQLAESRLVTAMQEKGAAERTATQEAGATQRAGIQAGTQRDIEASRSASADRRAAEDEIARREDQKFATTMAKVNQQFQAKQAELNRDQQDAIIAGDRKAKDDIDQRRDALRRFTIRRAVEDKVRTVNGLLSMAKGSSQKQTAIEKAKTIMAKESEEFKESKAIYTKTKERVSEAVDLDKRMSLPPLVGVKEKLEEKIPTKWGVTKGILLRGPVWGAYSALQRYVSLKKEVGEAEEKGFANPMAVLQDQVDKYGGKISIEDLTPGTISNIEDKIQTEDIQTEDINKTLGVLEGTLDALKTKRKGVEVDSKDERYLQDVSLEIAQMRDTLEGLVSSKKKITGSDKETVGARVQFALGTVYDSSLGGLVERMKELVGDDPDAVMDKLTEPLQVIKYDEITPDMSKYDKIFAEDYNSALKAAYGPNLDGILEEDFMGPLPEGVE